MREPLNFDLIPSDFVAASPLVGFTQIELLAPCIFCSDTVSLTGNG